MTSSTKINDARGGSLFRRRLRVVLIACFVVTSAGLTVYRVEIWKSFCHGMAKKSAASRDFETTERWLQRVSVIAPNDAETALLICGLARRTGHVDKFSESLELAENLGADAFNLQRERILFAAAAGQMRMAEPHLARLLQAEGHDNVDVSRAYINGYLRNQRLHRALPLIEAWMKDVPNDPEPWFIRGQIRNQRSEFVEAEADFREALRIDRDYHDASVSLASVLLKLGKFSEAESELIKARSLQPSNPATESLLAECCMTQRKFDDAREILESLLASNPEHFDALLLRAQLDADQGQFPSALERVDQLLTRRPRNSKARYLRATVLRNLDRVEDSEKEMELVTSSLKAESELQVVQQEISEKPEDPELLVKAAQLLLQVMDNDSQAIFALHAALDLQPDHQNALRLLSDLYAESEVESERKLGLHYRERLTRLTDGR